MGKRQRARRRAQQTVLGWVTMTGRNPRGRDVPRRIRRATRILDTTPPTTKGAHR